MSHVLGCFGWGKKDYTPVSTEGTGTTSESTSAPRSSASKPSAWGKAVHGIARYLPATIQFGWSLGGNGATASIAGCDSRYYPAINETLNAVQAFFSLGNAKLSSKAQARQERKTKETAEFAVKKGNGTVPGAKVKKDARTRKPIHLDAGETPALWEGLEGTIQGLFGDGREAENLKNAVTNAVSEQTWVTSKVNEWVPKAWVNHELKKWADREKSARREPSGAEQAEERKRLEAELKEDNLETKLKTEINGFINTLTTEGNTEQNPYTNAAKSLRSGAQPTGLALLSFLEDPENRSELSALILRAQRECQHAQKQLVLELAQHVSRPSNSKVSSNTEQQTPADKAVKLLKQIKDNPNTFTDDAFDFKCGLALTPNGMDALLCLEGKADWSKENKETYRNMLEVCAYLKMMVPVFARLQGKPLPKSLGLKDLLNLAQNHAVHYMIGANNDDPLRLAFQALVHSAYLLTAKSGPLESLDNVRRSAEALLGPKTARTACKAGYVAWCNGFQTSGKGTEFNAALLRLFKFRTYYHRATSHGERTAWNLTRDLVRQIRKALLGDKKDPLLGMVSTGDMGSGFNLRDQEQHQAFQARLKGGEINTPSGYEKQVVSPTESVLAKLEAKLTEMGGEKAEARVAVLKLWKEKGARSFRVHAGELKTVDDAKKTLDQAFGRSGFLHFRGPKVRLRTLEKWAVEAYELNGGKWKDPLKMPKKALDAKGDASDGGFKFLAQVNLLRRVANGGRLQGKDCGNLFQFSDLKNIAMGRPARQTVGKEMVKEVMLESVLGDEVISSVDSTYKGIDPGSIANLGLGKVAFGGLISNFSTGRTAIMQCGDGAHGTELIMGSAKHLRKEWGVRFGLSFAKLDKFLKFGPFASFSKVYDSMSTGSKRKDGAVAILIPQDRDTAQVKGQEGSTGGNKQIAEELTKFLVDFADTKDAGLEIKNIIDLWGKWCEKFDDPSRISLGFRDLAYEGNQTRVEGGVAARVKWKDKYHGAMAAATYVGVKGIDSRADKAGRHQVTRQTNMNEKFGVLSAAVSQGSETMWSDDSMSAATRAIPLIGAAVTFALDTENAITRLISEHGKINPVETNQDMVFADTNSWKNHLGGRSAEDKKPWLYKQTASGFKPTTYKAWDGDEYKEKTTSVNTEDEAMEAGGKAIDAMLNEADQHAPMGSNAKTTRWVLHPAAAEELTSIRSLVRTYRLMLATPRSEEDVKKIAQQIEAANQKATKIMTNKAFWQTKWATSATTVSKSNSFGWSWGIRFGNSSAVSSRPKTHRVFFGGDLRKQEANFTTPEVLQHLTEMNNRAASAA